MMVKKILISVSALVMICAALLVGANVLHVGQAKTAKASSAPNSLFNHKKYPTYVVHGIPGVPVDVYVNGKLAIPNFQPGTTVGPLNLFDTFYTVSLYSVGADPKTATPILKTVATIPSEFAPVSLVARLNRFGKPAIDSIVESDDFFDFPGEGMISARDASTNGLPSFEYCVTKVGSPQFIPLFNVDQYLQAGQYVVAVVPAPYSSCNNPLASLTVTIQSEVNLNVYVVGDQKSGTLQLITESLPDQGNQF